MRRKALGTGLIVFLLIGTLGCDSTDAGKADPNPFVGTWKLMSLRDTAGDKTETTNLIIDDILFAFDDAGNFELTIDYNAVAELAGRVDATLSGPYQVDEDAGNLTLLPVDPPLNALFAYKFDDSEAEITMSTNANIMNLILEPVEGQRLSGSVTVVVARQ